MQHGEARIRHRNWRVEFGHYKHVNKPEALCAQAVCQSIVERSRTIIAGSRRKDSIRAINDHSAVHAARRGCYGDTITINIRVIGNQGRQAKPYGCIFIKLEDAVRVGNWRVIDFCKVNRQSAIRGFVTITDFIGKAKIAISKSCRIKLNLPPRQHGNLRMCSGICR